MGNFLFSNLKRFRLATIVSLLSLAAVTPPRNSGTSELAAASRPSPATSLISTLLLTSPTTSLSEPALMMLLAAFSISAPTRNFLSTGLLQIHHFRIKTFFLVMNQSSVESPQSPSPSLAASSSLATMTLTATFGIPLKAIVLVFSLVMTIESGNHPRKSFII